MVELDWNSIQLVVFDIDGTLYDQRRLRVRIMADLMGHCLLSPREVKILRVISHFRRSREALAHEEADQIGTRQYARPAEHLRIKPAEVQRVVEKWMFERPLRYLPSCRFPAVGRFMDKLRAAGKTLAVFSDYPTEPKLATLRLEADLHVSALDPEVDRLKPHPRGLQRALELAGATSDRAVLIGDRDDRDGECARRSAVSYLIKTHRGSSSGNRFTGFEGLIRSL